MSTEAYCREIEAYLCRKNDGHLIRIVGPSFERVCRWAADGVPLKVAFQGIDRCFVRYYAKGGRRRPVQIDFCEHDVMDAFDAWRRAVGVQAAAADDDETGASPPERSRRKNLREHLDRICERATARRAGMTPAPPALDAVLELVTAEAAALKDLPGTIRGETRDRVIGRLAELDRIMLDAARLHADAAAMESIRAEAADQLLPFRDRMAPGAYQQALDNAIDRLLRDDQQLPVIAFE